MSLAYGGLLDYLIVVLGQMEVEVATVLPYHHLVTSDSAQADLETAALVERPASQLGSDHRIHGALEPVLLCTSDRF